MDNEWGTCDDVKKALFVQKHQLLQHYQLVVNTESSFPQVKSCKDET